MECPILNREPKELAPMRARSPDLRERIVAAALAGGQTRRQVAERFCVGLTTVENRNRSA